MEKDVLPLTIENWKISKIGVIGPGIVGMPMAAMLASADICIGTEMAAQVIVVQRNSTNSGWKVEAIKNGKSVIGGIEPGLDAIARRTVKQGLLTATHDYHELSDADVVLVSVQTDKDGFKPDYGPLFGALDKLAESLKKKPVDKIPLVIFESTLAPTSMDTLIRSHFEKFGLIEGRDILLGNSPNRVMPGRLVERIEASDKLAGGLHPSTSGLISHLYEKIVSRGKIFRTNSITAEIVKTLENAYRDVRIAFSAEIARYCDEHNIDFYKVREKVNILLSQVDNASSDPNAVPSGGLLIPMLGVGGHCLPKDGILLWWRNIEAGSDTSNSLILTSRIINDESPAYTFDQAEEMLGEMKDSRIALLGVAYRFNSEDTRNSPTIALANRLRDMNYNFVMHDPYVKADDQNLLASGQHVNFTGDFDKALEDAEVIILCTAHKDYLDNFEKIIQHSENKGGTFKGIMDACNLFSEELFNSTTIKYRGIGRGVTEPDQRLIDFVLNSFRAMEMGLANELIELIRFYNENYSSDEYNKVIFKDVQRLAKTCSTGCEIAEPGNIEKVPEYKGFSSRLVQCAFKAGNR